MLLCFYKPEDIQILLNVPVSEFEKVLLQTLTTYIVEESENGERQRRN